MTRTEQTMCRKVFGANASVQRGASDGCSWILQRGRALGKRRKGEEIRGRERTLVEDRRRGAGRRCCTHCFILLQKRAESANQRGVSNKLFNDRKATQLLRSADRKLVLIHFEHRASNHRAKSRH